ncbi:unnamed protein product [Natator depressus]
MAVTPTPRWSPASYTGELILGVNACLRCLDLGRCAWSESLSQLLIQLPRLKMQEWMVPLH